MAYNDYPGVSDSYDSDESIEQAQLNAAKLRRAGVRRELRELDAEGDGYTVLGRYYPNLDDARVVRGREVERRTRTLERLDATITALRIETEPS